MLISNLGVPGVCEALGARISDFHRQPDRQRTEETYVIRAAASHPSDDIEEDELTGMTEMTSGIHEYIPTGTLYTYDSHVHIGLQHACTVPSSADC